MVRRDEDIFKKLKKETPLAKTAPDSASADPEKRSAFDLMLEHKTGAASRKPDASRTPKRSSRTVVAKKASAKKQKELDVFSPSSKESVKAKEAAYDIDYGVDIKRAQAKRQEPAAKRQDKKRIPERKTTASVPKEELKPPISDSGRAQQKSIRADKMADKLRQKALLQELELDKVSEEAQRILSGKPEEGQIKPLGAQTQEPRRELKSAEKPRTKAQIPGPEKTADNRLGYKQGEKEPERKKTQTPELEFNEPDHAKSTQPADAVIRRQSSVEKAVQPAVNRKPAKSSISRTPMARPIHDNGMEVNRVFRHEIKYYINYKDYRVLRTALGAIMQPDINSDEYGGYHIRSLYFDDVYETALADKIAGTDVRCKYRIRIYNYQDDVIKLEKKEKYGKFIRKTSLNLNRNEYDSIIAGDGGFLLQMDEELAREFYFKMRMRQLRPKVIVDYWREAYVYPIEDVRVTFDIDLKGSTMLTDIFNPRTPVLPVFDNGILVLEVKFNRYLPEVIKCTLGSLGAVKRSAISKYVLCRKYD